METFIVLLRGINVSGQKKIKMVDLRTVLEKNGFVDVRTYIQSGNIVLASKELSIAVLEASISRAIEDAFGFEVPVLVKSKEDLKAILSRNPFRDLDGNDNKNVYFVLLKGRPDSDLVRDFERESYENEEFFVTQGCVYLRCHKGYGNAKLNNNLIERKLKVGATTRNYRTMGKLIAISESSQA